MTSTAANKSDITSSGRSCEVKIAKILKSKTTKKKNICH